MGCKNSAKFEQDSLSWKENPARLGAAALCALTLHTQLRLGTAGDWADGFHTQLRLGTAGD